MIAYAVRRTVGSVVVLLLTTLATFLIFTVLPSGDPAVAAAGKHAPPAVVAAVRRRLGLDKPLPTQYLDFLRGLVLHGDLGHSFVNNVSVRSEIASALPATIGLALGAALLWMALAIPSGIVAARRVGGWWDQLMSGIGLALSSVPTFALATVLLVLFARDIGVVHVFAGAGTYEPFTQSPGAWFDALLLPWIALALPNWGYYSQLLRTSLSEVMPEDYIRTARAVGVSERRLVWRHAMKVAIGPVVTSFGIDFGLLLGGAVLTEGVFGIPGLGALSLQAVQQQDLPVIQGAVLVGALFVVVANLVVDLVRAALDSRVRLT